MKTVAQPPTRETPTVLLVEDELELSLLMQEILSEAGYSVERAFSLSDAMAALAEEDFDAAVLDVELRDGVVFPAADILKHRGVPYVFVSAVFSAVVPAVHRAAPFVSKPYQPRELVSQLDAVVCRPAG